MKNQVFAKSNLALLSLTILVLCQVPLQALNISGFWSSDRHQIEVEVVATDAGIKVLRSGQGRWYHYQRVNPSTFRDQEGNTYRFRDNDDLEWTSYDARKTLRFRKKQANSYKNDVPNTRYQRRTLVTPRSMRGSWVDYRSGDCLDIRARRSSIRVDGIGIFTRTFHPTANGFRDHKGNVLRIENGRLIHVNRRGRVQGVFRR